MIAFWIQFYIFAIKKLYHTRPPIKNHPEFINVFKNLFRIFFARKFFNEIDFRPLFLFFGEITVFLFEQKSPPPTYAVNLEALGEGTLLQKFVG